MERCQIMKKSKGNILIPIQIRSIEGITITETKKISTKEVSIISNRYFPENSVIALTMLIPSLDNDGSGTKKISCEGKISTLEPVNSKDETNYNIDIFFIGMTADDKKLLEQLIDNS